MRGNQKILIMVLTTSILGSCSIQNEVSLPVKVSESGSKAEQRIDAQNGAFQAQIETTHSGSTGSDLTGSLETGGLAGNIPKLDTGGTLYKDGGELLEESMEPFRGSSHKFSYHTHDNYFVLTGPVQPKTDKIVVVWDGNSSSYKLSQFKSGDTKFRYVVSEKFQNLRDGENTYTVSFYEAGQLHSKDIYVVNYTDKRATEDFIIKKMDSPKEGQWDNSAHIPPIYYKMPGTNDSYYLGLGTKIGNYELSLGHGYTFVYTVYYDNSNKTKDPTKDPWRAKMKFNHRDEQGKVVSSNEITDIDFSIREFNRPTITFYPNDRYIVEAGAGFEGVSTHFLFDPKSMRIIDIYSDLEKDTLGYRSYPIFTSKIIEDHLKLIEYKYCCDLLYNPDGNEELIYDLQTMKLISKRLIAPIVFPTAGKEGKEITLTSSGSEYNMRILPQDYGFSIQSGESSYVVMNIDYITNYYKTAKPGYEEVYLDEITGVLYDEKYLKITKMKTHKF